MIKFLGLIMILFSVFGNNPTRIIFFGDSLTAGYGVGPDLAFPSLVEKKLKQEGKKVEVINAGLSGETSAGGLTRINWILNQQVDVFVLELGANDGLRGLPLEQTRNNLQAILEKVKEKNPKVKIIVAGMLVPPNMGPEYSNAFKLLFPDLANQNNAVLVPFLLEGVAGNTKLNQPDGLHPNAKGHEIVAETMVKYLNDVL